MIGKVTPDINRTPGSQINAKIEPPRANVYHISLDP